MTGKGCTQEARRMGEQEVGWGGGKEEGRFAVLLFTITRARTSERRDKKRKINANLVKEGRKEKEKHSKESCKERICFVNNTCSERIHGEGILINKSE